jgi:hypothetical protein
LQFASIPLGYSGEEAIPIECLVIQWSLPQSRNLSIVAGGIKVMDQAAWCPLTSKTLLGDNPTTMKGQSQNLCIPLKIMMGCQTKKHSPN